eukprot:CAMPEP_0184485072 /NCGR_PEP_ID=MMETSP0113_2-20130426/6714_1 /TAXON_ID=91329 /ORGANISM="Norrisiella sphaerica, Strain BC52" /LENGTH=380 /DNA_ID=CAMNT_0026866349 /DNA_START=67 /DNA_END=1209 /DNA_ORIENTATION=+
MVEHKGLRNESGHTSMAGIARKQEETKIDLSGPHSKENLRRSLSDVSVDKAKVSQELNVTRAAGVLGLASLALAAEATVIFISSNLNQPTGDLAGDSDTTFPPALLYSASAAEACAFVLGLFLAVFSLFFNINVPQVTAGVTALNSILLTYFFFVIIIAQPAFNWKNDLPLPLPPAGGWDTEYRKEVTFWMGHFIPQMCLSLMTLGFQISSLINLYKTQQDTEAKENMPNGALYFTFSFLVFWIGIGILTIAGWTRTEEGGWRLESPVVYPPTVIEYAGVAIISGLAVILYGLVNMAYAAWLSVTKEELWPITAFIQLLSLVAYIWLYGFHDLMQISLVSSTLSGVGAQYALLLISVVFAPVYYMGRVTSSLEKDDSVSL